MMEISNVKVIQSGAEVSWDSNEIGFVPFATEQVVHIC
jgi:hypothetical protein